jgi:hypothetical protein
MRKNKQNQAQSNHLKNEEKLEIEVTKQEEEVLNLGQDERKQPEPAYEKDQTAASGHMPDPESDDNALDMAQKAGLYDDAEPGEPEKVGIAEQVEQDEEKRREK